MLKQILIAALAFSAIAVAQPVAAARQQAQQTRIHQGVRNGSLTARETARLERQHAAIGAQIRRDRIDGGGMTAAERARIQKEQNQLSRRIAVQKNDSQTRR